MDRMIISHDQTTLGRVLIHDQHGVRCMSLVVALAKALGITDDHTLHDLVQGTFLHDVGKAWIPEWITFKAGTLTAEEYARMQLHSVYGETFLHAIDINGQVAPIVRHHHERWNGEGYPDHLAGTAIPMGARIVAPIDTYDALRMHRNYPRYDAHGHAVGEVHEFCHDQAMRIVEGGSGTAFDPRVVKAFIKLKDREFR
jgi:HD-GYP domain-containing protein (c-di-GMP phosphodiesterase class II)